MTSPNPLLPPFSIQVTEDPSVIQQLAFATWYPTYGTILSSEQIEFMLEELYSLPSLKKQMEEGQTFLLLSSEDTPAAFASFSLVDESQNLYKLNKLYIHPTYQGRGFGKILLQEVTQRIKATDGNKLELNVHRQNPALDFYRKHGFQISKKVDIPFGRFTLNDYILTLNLSNLE